MSKELIELLILIRNTNQFKPLVDWLASERETVRKVLETNLDEVMLRQAQGKAQALSRILAAIEESPKYLEKTRTPNK